MTRAGSRDYETLVCAEGVDDTLACNETQAGCWRLR